MEVSRQRRGTTSWLEDVVRVRGQPDPADGALLQPLRHLHDGLEQLLALLLQQVDVLLIVLYLRREKTSTQNGPMRQ